jgi:hypothetical protein
MVEVGADVESQVEKYGLSIEGLNSEIYRLLDKPFEKKKAPFSNFFLFLVSKIESFIDQISIYLRGIYDFDGKIFLETKEFLIKINQILLTQCREGNLDLFPLACISTDIVRLQGLSEYIETYVQKLTDNPFSYELNLPSIFSTTKNEIDNKLHVDYPTALSFHLSNWISAKWPDKKPITGPRPFVEELAHFAINTLQQLSEINYPIGVSLTYRTFREINKTLAEVFVHQFKTFTILELAALETELAYLAKIADEEFFALDKLKETLGQMMQLAQMFMTYHPLDYLDPTKRSEKFYSLGPQFLLKVLPKYRKKIVAGLPTVRKRDCTALIDQLSKQQTEAPNADQSQSMIKTNK